MILIAKAYSNTEELAENADKLVAVSGNGSGSVYAVRDHVADLRRLALNARARVAPYSKHLLFSVAVRNSVYRLADAVPLADILGKRTARDLMAVGSSGNRSRCLFFVQERKYGMRFLVDTGLEVSVVPLSTTRRSELHTSDIPRLTAANVTPIDVVGSRELTVDEGITRPMSWKFIVARIRQRILRADFLRHFNLLFNRFDHQLLIDMTYGLSRMDLSRSAKQNPSNHRASIQHHILTHGLPVFARPRRLPPDRLELARKEFDILLGIIRPSSSSWASPLHMVRKINRIPGAPVETTNVIKLFHKILPVEKIEDFADKSQRYALQKGVNFEVHVEVLMQFFGLILLNGYHSIPNENHFWSTADDVCVSIVPRVMARNKFKNVKRYFHLVDYSKFKKDDLMGNIKPLYDYLNQKLLQFGVFQEKLSIDESMGGVDTMDMLLSSYRPKIRSRKWWWNLFNNALNIAVVAAWRLHCELHDADRSTMTHLAFRRDITAHLLRARPLQISRPGPRIHLPHSLRSSRGHFLQSNTQVSTPTGSQFGHSTVNNVTKPGRYPIPNFNDFVTQLSGRTIFSKVGLIPAYQQIPVAEEIPKAAITTSFSLYEYVRITITHKHSNVLCSIWAFTQANLCMQSFS
ncbi:PiggyBac transposable element-derived protein 2 [Trichinella nativa]|uniref:PiggyBac transposable element-derived protein 2 n=1 Tax=Trichinella nativa TaxID=6335 RepID=A0A0V1KLV7_9BILA|nr:PiggyBac transposable element-derived protein 2 [Trichinella nativa]